MLENDGADALGLDFTVAEKLLDGSVRVIELVDQGSDIAVTDASKLEYVECKVRCLLFTSVHDQLFAFLCGLYEVIPTSLLIVFDPEELNFVLSGSDTIDVEDWESHTSTVASISFRRTRIFGSWCVSYRSQTGVDFSSLQRGPHESRQEDLVRSRAIIRRSAVLVRASWGTYPSSRPTASRIATRALIDWTSQPTGTSRACARSSTRRSCESRSASRRTDPTPISG